MTDLFSMGYSEEIEAAMNAPMRKIRLLSLFSGIGAFEKALDRCGIPYELIGYCEIDKYASKSYSAIHGVSEEKNLWDVCKVDAKPYLNTVDLMTYGFPCQDISIAGRQQGFYIDDGSYSRSGLFFEALRIINECKPKIAIAENVRNLMSQTFVDQYHTVQESLGAAGYNNYVQILNAKDYGIPQNRERVFIISIRKDIDIGYEFPNPIPLKLFLIDMLEEKVADKYYLSEQSIKAFEEHARRNAENGNGFGWNVYDVDMTDRQTDRQTDIIPLYNLAGKKTQSRTVYDRSGVSPTLCAGMDHGNTMPYIEEESPMPSRPTPSSQRRQHSSERERERERMRPRNHNGAGEVDIDLHPRDKE